MRAEDGRSALAEPQLQRGEGVLRGPEGGKIDAQDDQSGRETRKTGEAVVGGRVWVVVETREVGVTIKPFRGEVLAVE